MSLLFIQVAKYVCKLIYTKLLTASVVLQSAGGLAVLVAGSAYGKLLGFAESLFCREHA